MYTVLNVSNPIFYINKLGERLELKPGDQLDTSTLLQSSVSAQLVVADDSGTPLNLIVQGNSSLQSLLRFQTAQTDAEAAEPDTSDSIREATETPSTTASQATSVRASAENVNTSNDPASDGHHHHGAGTVERSNLEVDISSGFAKTDSNFSGNNAPDLDSNALSDLIRQQDQTVQAQNAAQASSDLPITIVGTFNGAVVEDSGIGAVGQLSLTGGAGRFPAQTYQGQYGDLSVDSSGKWQYLLHSTDSNVQGLHDGEQVNEKFVVHALNASGVDFSHEFTVDVTGTNDIPDILGADVGAVTEESQLSASGQMSIQDKDAGEDHFIAQDIQGAHGVLHLQENGAWSYDLNNIDPTVQALGAGQQTADTLVVQAADGTTHKIDITINGTNDSAVISGTDTGSVTEESLLQVSGKLDIQDTDSGEALFNAGDLQGQHGTLHLQKDGSWTYDLNNQDPVVQALGAGKQTSDTITVSSVEGTTRQITIAIHGTNDAAVVTDKGIHGVQEDTNLHGHDLVATGQLGIKDVDSHESYFQREAVTGTYGTFAINTDGHWQYKTDDTLTAIQALAPGQHVQDVASVLSADGTQHDLVVTITGSADHPVIHVSPADVIGSVIEDKSPGASGHLTADAVDQTASLTWSLDHSAGKYGSIMIDPVTGQWTYALGQGTANQAALSQQLQAGEKHTEVFRATVTDSHGTTSEQDISVRIIGTNDSPLVGGDQSGTVTEESHLTATGTLTITDVDHDEDHFQATDLTGNYGTLHLKADGSWSYNLDNSNKDVQALGTGKAGTSSSLTDTIEVQSADGTKHSITVTVNGTNDDPVLNTITAAAATEGDATTTTGTITSTDKDTGDSASYSTTANVAGFSLNANGGYTFDPSNAAYNGLAAGDTQKITIPVTVTDGSGGTDTKNLEITVTGTNDKPVLGAIAVQSATEDGAKVTGTITSTDVDAHETAAYTAPAIDGFSLDPATGAYTFDPSHSAYQHLAAGQDQTVTIPVTVTDQNGGTDTHNLVILVHGTADSAIISGTDTGSTTEETQLQASGQLTISDADNGEEHFSNTDIKGTLGTLHLTDSGAWTYDLDNTNPTVQALGDGVTAKDTITVKSADGTEHQIDITVNGTNDTPTVSAPVALPSGTEDLTQTITAAQLLANATDVDKSDVLTVAGLTADHGSISGPDSSGNYKFTPEKDYNGDVHFTYDVKDGHLGVVHTSATTTLAAVQDAAIVSGDVTGDVFEDNNIYSQNKIEVTGHLLVTDPDAGQQGFQYTRSSSVSDPFGGSLHISTSGTWTYDVDNAKLQHLGANQEVLVTHRVYTTDGTAQDIIIKVTGTNDAPVVSSEVVLQTGTEDTDIIFTQAQLLANSTDVDDNDVNQMHVDSVIANHGLVTKNTDGSFTFHPEKNYNGDVHFTYDVKDAHGGVTHTGATTALSAVNDNPDTQPVIDSITEDTDTHHAVNLLGGATDVDGDSLSISQVQVSFEGKTGTLPKGVSFASDGHTLVIDSHAQTFQHLGLGEKANIEVHYMVDDNHGGQTPAVATITMVGADDKANLASNVIQITETQAIDSQHHVYKGSLQLIDPDSGDNTQFVHSGTYLGQGYSPGYFNVYQDGSYDFSLQPALNRSATDQVASLKNGESMEIPYEIQTSDGQSLTIMVKVIGEDNQARIVVTPYTSLDNHAYEDHTSFGNTTNQVRSGGTLNVIDPDHDQAGFIAQNISTPEGGSFYINPRGNWAYTIDNDKLQHLGAGENYQKTFTVASIDGSAHQNITVTVHGTNDAPVVSAEVHLASGLEDSKITITETQLLANTSDIDDNDIGKLSIENLHADHGSISLNADRTFTFTPPKDYNGQVHFTYDVKDAHGGLTHTGATTTLAAVQDAAVITQTPIEVTEDTTQSATIHLGITDKDAGEDHFNVATLKGAHGSATIAADGTLVYTLDNAAAQHLNVGQSITDAITVTSADGTTHDVSVTIHGSNDNPVIGTIAAQSATEGGAAVTGTITSTDVDSGDTATYTTTTSPAGFTLNSNGTYSLDPANAAYQHLAVGEPQVITVPVIATDSHTGVSSATDLVITITGTNDTPTVSAPVALPSGTEDLTQTITAAQLLANATDVDKTDVLTVAGLSANHGSISGPDSNGNYKFTPDKDYNGDVHFTYDVEDGHGGVVHTSATTTLAAVNDNPIFASALTASFTEDTSSSTLNLLTGATDIDADTLTVNSLKVSIDGATAAAQLPPGISLAADGHTLNIDPSNAAFAHLAQGAKQVILVTYDISDGKGGTVAQTATMNVTGTNDVPTVTQMSVVATTNEDTPITLTTAQILTGIGAQDVDGDTLTISQIKLDSTKGTLVDNHDGTYTITPAANFNGELALTGVISDGTATQAFANKLSVTSVNDIPTVTQAQHVADAIEETPFILTTAQILSASHATDLDGDTLSVSGLSVAANQGTVHDNGNGTWTITPAKDFFGTLDVSANVVDGQGGSVNATLNVNVQNTPDAAQISGTDSASLTEDSHVYSAGKSHIIETGQNHLNISDSDVGEAIFTPTGSAHGSGTAATGSWVAGDKGVGEFILHADGRWLYQANNDNPQINALSKGESLTETLTVHSKDGTSHVLTVTIQGTNDAPVIISSVDLGSTAEDTAKHFTASDLLANATDAEGGALSIVAGSVTVQHGSLSGDAQNGFTFTPDPNFHGNDVDIQFQVTDGTTPVTGHATLDVTSVNDNPIVASSLSINVTEDASATTLNLLSGASDIEGDALSIAGLKVSIDGAAATAQLPPGISLATDGHTLNIDPSNAAFAHLAQGAKQVILVTYDISDGKGGTVAQTATMNVTGTNDVPTVTQMSVVATTNEDTPITLTAAQILTGIGAQDVDGDTLTISQIKLDSTKGTLVDNHDGTYTITPAANFNGELALTGVISDGTATQAFANKLSVTSVNDIPTVTQAQHVSDATEDTPFTLTTAQILSASHATDLDGDTLSVSGLSVAANQGTVHDNGNGTWTITPAKDFFGTLDVSANVVDGHGGTVNASLNVNVQNTPDAAQISGTDSASLTEDSNTYHAGSIEIISTGQNRLSISDSDVGEAMFTPTGHAHGTGTAATGSWVSGDKGVGQFILHADGRWLYHVDNDNSRINSLGDGDKFTETLTVHSKDGTAHVLTATVNGHNDGPQAVGTVANTDHSEGHAIDMTLPSNLFTDAEGDSFTLSLAVSQHTEEAVNPDSVNPGWQGKDTNLGMPSWLHFDANTGRIWGTPPHSADGDLDITVTATDKKGATDTYDFHITVTDVDASGIAHANVNDRTTGQHSANGQLDAYHNGQHIIWHEQATGQDSTPNMIQGKYGHLQISTGGTWIYYLDHDGARGYSNKDLNALKAGQVEQEHFTIHGLQNGKEVATEQVIIAVTGKNDGATINGTMTSSSSAAVTEDASVNSVAGHLTLVDADHGEDHFTANPHIAGTYGHLELTATGYWVYHLNNALPATQALNSGAQGHETFVITSPDGTATHKLTIDVNGSVDKPTITDTGTHIISEDYASQSIAFDLQTNTVDTSQTAQFGFVTFEGQPKSIGTSGATAIDGKYGSFVIDQDGHAHYFIENSKAATQALGPGQTVHETFSVTALTSSGQQTTHDVVVDVRGSVDAPSVSVSAQPGAVHSNIDLTGNPDIINTLNGVTPDSLHHTYQKDDVVVIGQTKGAKLDLNTPLPDGFKAYDSAGHQLAYHDDQTGRHVGFEATCQQILDGVKLAIPPSITSSNIQFAIGHETPLTIGGLSFNAVLTLETSAGAAVFGHVVPHNLGAIQAGDELDIKIDIDKVDTGGSESLSTKITGVPHGVELHDDSGHSIHVNSPNQVINLNGWDLDHLHARVPAGLHHNAVVQIIATATGADGTEATTTKAVPMVLNPNSPGEFSMASPDHVTEGDVGKFTINFFGNLQPNEHASVLIKSHMDMSDIDMAKFQLPAGVTQVMDPAGSTTPKLIGGDFVYKVEFTADGHSGPHLQQIEVGVPITKDSIAEHGEMITAQMLKDPDGDPKFLVTDQAVHRIALQDTGSVVVNDEPDTTSTDNVTIGQHADAIDVSAVDSISITLSDEPQLNLGAVHHEAGLDKSISVDDAADQRAASVLGGAAQNEANDALQSMIEDHLSAHQKTKPAEPDTASSASGDATNADAQSRDEALQDPHAGHTFDQNEHVGGSSSSHLDSLVSKPDDDSLPPI